MSLFKILKKYQVFLKLFISTGILLYLSWTIDWNLISSSFKDMNLEYLALVFLLIIPTIIMRAYRYILILNARIQEDKRLNLLSGFKLYCVGYGLNLIIPGSGGDFARVYYGYKKFGVKEELFSSYWYA